MTAKIKYDFGNGWEFIVTRMADKPKAAPFTCVKSEGGDAMEDCGGVWGLSSIYEELEEWLGQPEKERENFDGELFNWSFDLSTLTEEEARRFLNGPSAEEVTAILQQ